MTEVVISGIGLMSCLGDLTQTWESILQGVSGIKLKQPFLEIPPLPLAMLDTTPIDMNKLIYRVINAALEDAQLQPPLPECGIVVSSSRAFQGKLEILATHSTQEKIKDWWEMLPMFVSLQAARIVGSETSVLSPQAACATGIWAIAQAYELIKHGYCERVITGAIEAPITPLTIAGFEKMGALAKVGCYPFDLNRQGLVLAEAGAVLVLETEELAARRGAKIYGKMRGFGLTCDGDHITAPSDNIETAIKALKQSLWQAKIKPQELNYIHAHGTGTKLNDAREARIINQLWPLKVPVSSTKGATGHSLGGSGALGAAFCLMALKHQILPPCIGLSESEFELNLIRKAYGTLLEKVMCLSFGFGGQNSAIVFSKN